ncbi:cytidylyltransferase domain-containing protein [Christiangramia sediminis]|uniref:Acylneuraminate cytidylyltransferase family protein n=1 Tax=Christiangramia sediminis TaxID=2881336 RepID=A0A9X1LHY1_9FLAO|nr:acylneuraminate cytidylyltransferase family protein [Christiangramia sediminis]MCB7480623.1 acylneuraminate cytidylyltransferase family protein [Christiangramia sediminis]
MLVLIPARGGSKGVPGKNIKLLNGKPLIYYTLEAARELFDDKDILVSTDDLKIKDIVQKSGLSVPFLRPENLATDTSSSYEVILHAIQHMENLGRMYTDIMILQPTSPFRNSEHISEALEIFKNSDVDMVVSVKETKANPYYILFEEDEYGFLHPSKEGVFDRRQDCPKVWEYNGAIYIIRISSIKENSIGALKKIKKYIMDDISSVDIDTEFDWIMAETIKSRL